MSFPHEKGKMNIDPRIRVLETAVFPATDVSVGKARRWLREVLREHPRCDDGVWLLSEVFTNSVLHTRSRAVGIVVLVEHSGRIQVEVVDEGAATLPHACERSPEPTSSGRGIQLVRILASRWGFMEEKPRCVVWFELDLEPARVAASATEVGGHVAEVNGAPG
jgi:anti-sigma regulatory factor (Ser/Thr protein kinase)